MSLIAITNKDTISDLIVLANHMQDTLHLACGFGVVNSAPDVRVYSKDHKWLAITH